MMISLFVLPIGGALLIGDRVTPALVAQGVLLGLLYVALSGIILYGVQARIRNPLYARIEPGRLIHRGVVSTRTYLLEPGARVEIVGDKLCFTYRENGEARGKSLSLPQTVTRYLAGRGLP